MSERTSYAADSKVTNIQCSRYASRKPAVDKKDST